MEVGIILLFLYICLTFLLSHTTLILIPDI